jgi:ribosomal protein L11 methyltransferase
MPWLALTLELDSAQADRFSDALLDAGAQSVSLEPGTGESQTLVALLPADAQAEAIVATAAPAIGAPVPAARRRAIDDRDWVRESQAQFAPCAVGTALWVGPTWCQAPEGVRALVRLDPGLAFGTGSHPSTRLVLQFLVRRLVPGMRVLDYGCGSGILAIAAAKLGAGSVDAVDVDPQAVETTNANARENQAAVRAALPQELAPDRYDMVISNILAQPLILLAPLLASRSAVGGRIALSGILQDQAADVAAAYAPYYEIGAPHAEDGWALVEGVRR